MQARRKTGQYTGHHTPGDGTGMNRLPEKNCFEILTDAKLAKADGTDFTDPQQFPAHEDHDCKGDY